jgi:hypothetical protein
LAVSRRLGAGCVASPAACVMQRSRIGLFM